MSHMGSGQASSSEAVVEVRGLTMRFGDRLVHEALDLSIARGEVLAIVGGSGSGKTTLLREMVLLQRPSAGSVRLLGQETSGASEAAALRLRRRIGVLFQNGALFGGMSVLDNVAFPLREHTRLSEGLIKEIASLKLNLVGLTAADGLLYPSQLSGGMRKRAALARAIALDPELLFLDEPTSGLDPLSADAFDDLVLELKSALDLTVVLVTHDMDSLWRVAERVVLLGDGRLLAQGSVAELAGSTDPAVIRFFHGPRGRAAQQSARGGHQGSV
jgi:phospholipid/cholesterol/gamma-HCH transport system ATP-binding protein